MRHSLTLHNTTVNTVQGTPREVMRMLSVRSMEEAYTAIHSRPDNTLPKSHALPDVIREDDATAEVRVGACCGEGSKSGGVLW